MDPSAVYRRNDTLCTQNNAVLAGIECMKRIMDLILCKLLRRLNAPGSKHFVCMMMMMIMMVMMIMVMTATGAMSIMFMMMFMFVLMVVTAAMMLFVFMLMVMMTAAMMLFVFMLMVVTAAAMVRLLVDQLSRLCACPLHRSDHL